MNPLEEVVGKTIKDVKEDYEIVELFFDNKKLQIYIRCGELYTKIVKLGEDHDK